MGTVAFRLEARAWRRWAYAARLHGVGLPRAGEGQDLLVAWLRDGRVDVELVDDEVGLVPPALGRGALGVDELGQHAVVHVVEVVVALDRGDGDVGEPLDHAAADVPKLG